MQLIFLTRLAGGSASASVNWAKSGFRCSSSNPNGTIFPLNTVTLSRMPPLEYDAPPVCVAVWASQAYVNIIFDQIEAANSIPHTRKASHSIAHD